MASLDINANFDTLLSENSKLKSQIKRMKEEEINKDNEIYQLTQNLKDVEKKFKVEIKIKNEDIDELEDTIEDLKRKMSMLEKRSCLSYKMSDNESSLEETELKIKEIDQLKEELLKKDEMIQELDSVKEELNSLRLQNNGLINDIQSLKMEIIKRHQQVCDKDKEMSKLVEEISTFRELKAKWETDKEKFETTNRDNAEAIKLLKPMIDDQTEKLHQIQKTKAKHIQKKVSALRKEKDEIEANLADKNTDLSSSITKPFGFDNPLGYCFLNSVIQVLRGCRDFNRNIREYHEKSKIGESQEKDEKKSILVINFCRMMYDMKEGRLDETIRRKLHEIQNYFKGSSTGDDVNKFFMELITIINAVTKNSQQRELKSSNIADRKFEESRNINYGFVFDCFYGQMAFDVVCDSCNETDSSTYQLFTSLALQIPIGRDTVDIHDCIELLLKKSKIDNHSLKCSNCKCREFFLHNRITHSPKYLYLYIGRGSLFTGSCKNETFVKCDGVLNLKLSSGLVKYQLISVIDHIDSNVYGDYYCKYNYESQRWWLLDDSRTLDLGKCNINEVVTKNSIVFMFMKKS